ncbi:hypothetical protein [Vibrio diabolicus]
MRKIIGHQKSKKRNNHDGYFTLPIFEVIDNLSDRGSLRALQERELALKRQRILGNQFYENFLYCDQRDSPWRRVIGLLIVMEKEACNVFSLFRDARWYKGQFLALDDYYIQKGADDRDALVFMVGHAVKLLEQLYTLSLIDSLSLTERINRERDYLCRIASLFFDMGLAVKETRSANIEDEFNNLEASVQKQEKKIAVLQAFRKSKNNILSECRKKSSGKLNISKAAKLIAEDISYLNEKQIANILREVNSVDEGLLFS